MDIGGNHLDSPDMVVGNPTTVDNRKEEGNRRLVGNQRPEDEGEQAAKRRDCRGRRTDQSDLSWVDYLGREEKTWRFPLSLGLCDFF